MSLDKNFYLDALCSFNRVSTHWAYGTCLFDSTIKKGQKLITKTILTLKNYKDRWKQTMMDKKQQLKVHTRVQI
jgi:hypothetical protein